jgi:hypothetical protein
MPVLKTAKRLDTQALDSSLPSSQHSSVGRAALS